jgi:hypothetical protein
LAIAFLDSIEALGKSLGPEVKEVGISLVVIILFDLEIAGVIKV